MQKLLDVYFDKGEDEEATGPGPGMLFKFEADMSDSYLQLLVGVFFTLIVILISAATREFQPLHRLTNLIPESAFLLVLGALVGLTAHYIIECSQTDHVPVRVSHVMIRDLLIAPIILHGSYDLYHPQVFIQTWSILAMAFVATILNTLLTGLSLWLAYAKNFEPDMNLYQCLTFASLISAVDPVAVLVVFESIGVDRALYYLVFGEALLNDGVTFVLFEGLKQAAMVKTGQPVNLGYVGLFFLTATLGGATVGFAAGALSSMVTKHIRTSSNFDASSLITLVFVILGYLVALRCNFSSIIAVIACGLTQMRYTITNLHPNARLTIRNCVKAVANIFETVIFVLLGNLVISVSLAEIWRFALATLATIYLSRLVVTFGLSWLLNRLGMSSISYRWQAVIWMGGLRGVIAFTMAVSYLGPYHMLFHDTTLLVVFLTTVVNGIATKPLVNSLHLKGRKVARRTYLNRCVKHVAEYAGLSLREIIGEGALTSRWWIWIKKFEQHYIFRILCKDGSGQSQMVRDLWDHEREVSDIMLESHATAQLETAGHRAEQEDV